MSDARDTSNDVNYNASDVRAWLEKHKYSHADLAELLGLTRQAVIYWTNGTRRVPEPIGRLLHYFDQHPEAIRHF